MAKYCTDTIAIWSPGAIVCLSVSERKNQDHVLQGERLTKMAPKVVFLFLLFCYEEAVIESLQLTD